MKYITLISFLFLTSCEKTARIPKDPIIMDFDNTQFLYGDVRIYKKEVNGHSYLFFSHSRVMSGIEHDPDCQCFKTK